MNKNALLVICIVSIYGSFLSWSYLQEKLTKSNYGSEISPVYFNLPLIINIAQSFTSILVSSIFIKCNGGNLIPQLPRSNWVKLYIISVSQSISSPISYLSLNYVSYLIYLLAKSCKLIPVLTVHYFLYSTVYPLYKYGIAFIITAGVSIFTVYSSSSNKLASNGDNNVLGILILVVSLFLDGFMNSTQDTLFKSNRSLKGANVMLLINIFTFVNLTLFTGIFTTQFSELKNILTMPILEDLFKFCVCGSVGQIFIFLLLQNFNSVILVTVTVTRKIISMLLSVILFGHTLNFNQWMGLIIVFIGVGLESSMKFFVKRKAD